MERRIETFDAAKVCGVRVTVNVFQEFVEATAMGDTARQWIPGMKRMELGDGSPVNYIDANTFKIVETDEIIRKVA